MHHRTNGHGSLFPRPSTTNFYLRRPNLTTAVKPQPKTVRCCDHCQRRAPRLAIHVDQLDGGSSDTCRSCYQLLVADERHQALIARFHNLFQPLISERQADERQQCYSRFNLNSTSSKEKLNA